MPAHQSLVAPFLEPTPIHPGERMDPYKNCWCGSEKKWKWCHKDRAKQEPIHLGALLAGMREEMQRGYCSHPEASPTTCSDRIVRAHTIQRRGGIADIAEGAHVASVKAGVDDMYDNEGRIEPKSVGVRSASTFNGFCETHDRSMFRPLEVGSPTLAIENVFLLSFRAMAYELFAKRAALRSVPIQRDLDRGAPFEAQAAI